MSDSPIIEENASRSLDFYLYNAGGIALLCSAYFFIYRAFSETYPQLIDLISGGSFLIFGILCFYKGFRLNTLEIYNDSLVIKSFLGYTKRTILFEDINSWSEIEKSDKGSTWTVLTIYTTQGKYNISSKFYKEFNSIKNYLTDGKFRDTSKEYDWKGRVLIFSKVFGVLAGLLFFSMSYHIYSTSHTIVYSSNLITLKQVIVSGIAIVNGGKGSRYLNLELKDYPNFIFQIDGSAYSATSAKEFVTDVNYGDTLFLDIKVDAFKMKLSKEKPLSLFDKTVNYKFISVYGLRDKKVSYLTLPDYNIENKKGNPFYLWWSALGGMAFLLLAIFGLKPKK